MSDDTVSGARPQLEDAEIEAAEERVALRPQVVYEAIRQEGETELTRSTPALAWSGLAAGLSMGFSLVAQGLLASMLPHAAWTPLLSRFGYSFGFLLVIMGRQQLFTENTLTVILPLLSHRDARTLGQVLRLWSVVLVANVLGAFLVSLALARTGVFDEETRRTFAQLSREAIAGGPLSLFGKAIFSGWLIALMVWMLPAAESSRMAVIAVVTYLVGLGNLAHVVAGSVEASYLVAAGELGPAGFLRFLLPTLAGNIVGGVSLVAALNHAQVMAGAQSPPSTRRHA